MSLIPRQHSWDYRHVHELMVKPAVMNEQYCITKLRYRPWCHSTADKQTEFLKVEDTDLLPLIGLE